MAEAVTIKVDGLKAFQRNLKALDDGLPKGLRKALNTIADDVIALARPLIPHRSGRAAASLKASSTAKAVRVKEGSARAPYMPWLEFGGAVGRGDSVKRARVKGGRYLYPALGKDRPRIEAMLTTMLQDFAEGLTDGE